MVAIVDDKVLFDNYIVHYGSKHSFKAIKVPTLNQTWTKICANSQVLRNHEQHLIILSEMDRWKDFTKPYAECLTLFKKTIKVTESTCPYFGPCL